MTEVNYEESATKKGSIDEDESEQVKEDMTQLSGGSSVICKIPLSVVEDNTKEI